MAIPNYRYKPLTNQSSFRLIRIPKAQPDLSTGNQILIEVNIFEANFGDAPDFEAVSYAWGQTDATSAILCNGQILFVTPNVGAILHMLAGEQSDAAFWIDSICIDQASVPEKNIQVPKMRSIYREARLVWVWLGQGTFETLTAMRFLVELTTIWKEVYRSIGSGVPGLVKEFVKPHAQFKEKIRVRRDFYDAVDTNFIVDLLNLPWFHRTWTVQELVLARSAIFICGSERISYHDLLGTLPKLERHELATSRLASRSNPASYYRDETKCYRELTKLMLSRFRQHSSISAILRTVRPKTSSKPEDKVYGVYGIFNHMKIENLPQVDYNRPVHLTYTEITTTAIEAEHSLNVLYSTYLPQIVSNLPSWVPDWSNSAYHRPIALFGMGAAGTTTSNVFYKIQSDRLTVKGKIIDVIRDLAVSTSIAMPSFRRGYEARLDFRETESRRTGVLELVRTLQAWVRLSRESQNYPTGITPQEAFRDVVLQNSPLQHNPEIKSLDAMVDKCIEIITAKSGESSTSLQALHDEIRKAPEYEAIVYDYHRVFEQDPVVENWPEELQIRLFLRLFSPGVAAVQHDITLNTYHKTFLASRDGYMGTCPRWARGGDLIALISGLDLPFILRKEGEHYKLVGPAYIHGVMHGERWSTDDVQDITLV